MTISISSLVLTGTSARTISETTIRKCAGVFRENELTSFWGRVKDHFLGTRKEEAKRAIFRLATAENTKQQCYAFSQLASSIEPTQNHLLRWNLSADKALDFQIGERKFPMKSDAQEFMKAVAPISFDDSCRLLIALKMNGHDVLTESEHFGLPLKVLAQHPDDPSYASFCTSAVLGLPALLDAIQVLGLHHASKDNQLATDVATTVENMVYEMRSDAHIAYQCHLHAQELVNIAAAIGDRS